MRPRRPLSLLLAAALVLALTAGLTACTGPSEEAPPPETATPSPKAVPSPAPRATPTPSATPSTAPVPTTSATPATPATPSPTPTAAATPSPSPTPTVATSPTPTPIPAPLITAEDLGIREVDTAEALAAAGLTHVRFAAGEEVPWDVGLFLLDVESGEVEGWVHSLVPRSEEERSAAGNASEDLDISPSNRFVSWRGHGILYDRHAGRTYALDRNAIEFDRWWGAGPEERLLFRLASSGAFVAMDAELRPVARLELPPGERFASPDGGYILVREPGSARAFHLVNLADEANPRVHTWVLPWEALGEPRPASRIELLDNLIAFVGSGGDSACHVTRYDLGGVLLSNQTIPCGLRWLAGWGPTSLPRISPDGRLVASVTFDSLVELGYGREPVGMVLSILDAATGASVARVLGAHPAWIRVALDPGGDVWLADSSGIIVQTHHGWRLAGLDLTWGPAPGWASPDDPALFFEHGWRDHGGIVAVVDQQGDEQASLSFGPPSAAVPGPGDGSALILLESAGWGARSDTLRVWTSYFHTQHIPTDEFDLYGVPPLAAVIESPPFDDRLLVEVVVDTCLNVREQRALDSRVLTCLPNGAIAETDRHQSGWMGWMHIRTDDGIEGWALAEDLRWYSDGVRLEE